ncbi:hypothetical protein EW026_g4926 [Hermanssonia centrifuga]|uniref:non-specific serine/threonine protein kinase n=1 Tax=Hermanssonia centrifuga TaxID=98765 RepID=A0A4S4KFQ2_9APHY|nr:hypothetical protein EW026_g4926 [Hermanssonia centrifuga]
MAIFIKLRLLHKAGCGAYGVVYLAWDLSTPQHNPTFYAVKCLLKYEPGSDLAHIQQREIAFHKSVSHHPNVATLHTVIEEEYYVYLVMDYYEGGDLFSAICDRRSFFDNNQNVKRSFLQLLDAVQACHDAGVYHRDLKPENVLCSQSDSRFFLSDFGLATRSVLTRESVIECIGSSSDPVPYSTRHSDVWSLGVILTNMLTGRNPWRVASAALDEGYAQYLRDGPQYLACVLPVSPEAAGILGKILDPNPLTRATIPELNAAIMNATDFFPLDDVPEYIRLADQSFEASLENTDGDVDTSSIIDVTFEMQVPPSLIPMYSEPSSDVRTLTLEITTSSFVNQISSSTISDSDSESGGPVTPVTRSIELTAVVPHLELAADVESAGVEEVVLVAEPAKAHTARARRPSSTTVQRFIGAIHRIAVRA